MSWLAVYVKFCIAERYWELGAARASQVSNDGLSPPGLRPRPEAPACCLVPICCFCVFFAVRLGATVQCVPLELQRATS